MATRSPHYNTRYKHDLTPRQRQVLDLVARGCTNSEIARRLELSLDGAKWHVSEILSKLGVQTREEAADYWRAHNRPWARVSRGVALLGPFGALKTALGAAAGVALAVVSITAYFGLDQSGSEPPVASPPAETGVPTLPPQPTRPATLDGITAGSTTIPPEVLATADQLARLVHANNIAGLLALSMPQTFSCPAGPPRDGAPYPLCEGAAANEQRLGFRIALHGGEGETVGSTGFEAYLRRSVSPAAKLVSIGCGDGKYCDAGFVVAFSPALQTSVFYFELSNPHGGGEPKIHGLGLSGDNADDIVHGGATMSWLGSTVFYPVK